MVKVRLDLKHRPRSCKECPFVREMYRTKDAEGGLVRQCFFTKVKIGHELVSISCPMEEEP